MYFLIERHRRVQRALWPRREPLVADFLFEKDKIFAYLNLDNEELKLYERYFERMAAELPRARTGDLFAGFAGGASRAHRKEGRAGRVAHLRRSTSKRWSAPTNISFFAMRLPNLLVVNTSEIDFVNRNADLQQLLRRLEEPVKGTQYFLPLGTG